MSKIEVDTIDKQSGSTLTLGGPGTAVTLGSGATQTGFGRTGTVDWQTTVKTTAFTAASGEGYFVNTTSGEIIVTLPTGSAGDIIAVKDYAGTFDTNQCKLNPSGSDKINGVADDAFLTQQGLSVTLVFLDSTKGWLAVNDSTNDTTGIIPAFISATGGNATITCGDFKTHIFTSSGTFCVSNAGNAGGSNKIDYFVVAGGGGGGGDRKAGAGAGGFRLSNEYGLPAPLNSPLISSTGITVTATGIPVTIGAGGSGGPGAAPTKGSTGSNTIFSTITSAGGGFGDANPVTPAPDRAGGSGGGAGDGGGCTTGGAGNTPPVSPPQGNSGGNARPGGNPGLPAGGGGAGAVGSNGATPGSPGVQAPGGIGSFIDANFIGPTAPSYGEAGPVSNTRYFAGGDGGGGNGSPPAGGGIGGGGNGGGSSSSPPVPTTERSGGAGTANTGGGGGGSGEQHGPSGGPCRTGGAGGSGIVMIRYKFQ